MPRTARAARRSATDHAAASAGRRSRLEGRRGNANRRNGGEQDREHQHRVGNTLTESEIVWVFIASGVVVYLVRIRPGFAARASSFLPWTWWVTGLHGPATGATLWKLCIYFAEAGAFVFGSGLAIVPFLGSAG